MCNTIRSRRSHLPGLRGRALLITRAQLVPRAKHVPRPSEAQLGGLIEPASNEIQQLEGERTMNKEPEIPYAAEATVTVSGATVERRAA
jgi:hypothetical protein